MKPPQVRLHLCALIPPHDNVRRQFTQTVMAQSCSLKILRESYSLQFDFTSSSIPQQRMSEPGRSSSRQPVQAGSFSSRARFPLPWRWRHAAAPRTEGRARQLTAQPQLHPPFSQTVDWTGRATTEQPAEPEPAAVTLFPCLCISSSSLW